ncbi:MAG: hypothetical protein HC888_13065 [Candidatus Competibacteraceae bacterium]|nr:hypothetical protein [Candidatus Competibacteraceae bacterium]
MRFASIDESSILHSVGQTPEPSDVLLEVDVISGNERADILSRIDKEISHYYLETSDVKHFTAGSNGLVVPFLIILSAVIISVSAILVFDAVTARADNGRSTTRPADYAISDWGILRHYREESSRKLADKEKEIRNYRIEISEYDRKLTVLRELLTARESIEARLAIERQRLSVDGISEETIQARINNLENSLVHGLSPELIALNNLGIDQINSEIERILAQKTMSEDRLKQSLIERESLLSEDRILEEDEKRRTSEDLAVLELVRKVNKLSDEVSNYERSKAAREQVDGLYAEVFESLYAGRPEAALSKMNQLRQLAVTESAADADVSPGKSPIRMETIDLLQDYISTSALRSDARAEADYAETMARFAQATEQILKNTVTGNPNRPRIRSVRNSRPFRRFRPPWRYWRRMNG